VCEDGLFIPGFVVHHAHGEKMERVKEIIYVLIIINWEPLIVGKTVNMVE
jgi:hypothetical protein